MKISFDKQKLLDVLGRTNVHVDFHNPPYQVDICADFDGDQFGKMLADANVDSVSIFAKDYHGMAYYDTKYGYKHPYLKRDFLREVIDGCHKHGVKAFAYYAIALDTAAGEHHPEWLQVGIDGSKRGEFGNNKVNWVCLNTAYTDQMFIPMVREVLENYNVDGFFFDELFYYQDSCKCPRCIQLMKERGLNPDDPKDLQWFRAYSTDVFATRVSKVIHDHNPDLPIIYNPTTNIFGVMDTLVDEENVIVVGGHEAGWGYINMPMEARHVRNYDLPVLAMNCVFHRRWGDFGSVKQQAQLEFEVSEMLSHHFVVSIGDHMRPRGVLEPAKYEAIGKAFKRVKELNVPMLAKPVKDIAVVTHGIYDSTMVIEGRCDAETFNYPLPDGVSGSTKALLDTHQQFDVLTEPQVMGKLSDYRLIILPEGGYYGEAFLQEVREYVKNGGKLIATGNSTLDKGKFQLEDVLGVEFLMNSPYDASSSVFYDLYDYKDNLPDVITKAYSGYQIVIPREGAIVKSGIYAPSGCDRMFTAGYMGGPAEFKMDTPGIVYNKYGAGEAVYVATDIFTAYYSFTYHAHKSLINNIVTSLQKIRALDCTGSGNIRVNLMDTAEGTFLHVINYYADEGGATLPRIMDNPPPIDVTVRVYAPHGNAVAVSNVDFNASREGDYLVLALKQIGQHEVLKII